LVAIEKAREDDIESVLGLDGHPEHDGFLASSVRLGHCWIARDGTAPVGFAVADTSFFEQCFVWALSTHREHRRHGVGTALIRHVESVCTTRKLFTSTNESNAAARKLFESLGFIRSGIIENLDERDPEVVYFKRIR
jgi:ribosomal protein S18 acetylase RimI-like enzyme